MQSIIECVPNFSEGRDVAKVETIIRALLDGPDVYLLDQEMDADHNRCVITLVGARESIGEAALRGIGAAAELIDLNHHQGAHPRCPLHTGLGRHAGRLRAYRRVGCRASLAQVQNPNLLV